MPAKVGRCVIEDQFVADEDDSLLSPGPLRRILRSEKITQSRPPESERMELGRGDDACAGSSDTDACTFSAPSARALACQAAARAFFEATMFRISRGDWGFDSDTMEQARELLRGEKPDLFHVDEIRADPFPCSHTSRAWGKLIRHDDGRVEGEPWPWQS